MFVFLTSINILNHFDMLPAGKRKPGVFKPSGRPVRVNTSDAKQVPIRETLWDAFREVAILKSNKVKHNIYVPKGLVPQPANVAAMLAGDTRNNTIDLPIDIAGRFVDWKGGGYPMVEQERTVGELRRQNYMLQRRIDRISEPADNFFDSTTDKVDRLAEITGKLNASSREATGEMKRRG